MILEAVDKAGDIARDYLVAPTATASAPAIDVLPKPWPEVITAFLFVVICLTAKAFHKHYQQHKALRKAARTPGGMMQAGDLRRGDTFIECSEEEWAELSERERKKLRRVKVLAIGPECKGDRTRVHLVTDVGNWCIPFVAPVIYAPTVKPTPHRPAPAVHSKSRAAVPA